MAKKRKTLPKNFRELIEAKDIPALKAVFGTCEINAYDNGFDKNTALHTFGVPDELVCWLAERGADINARNHYERTPLHEQAGYWRGNAELFIELGAEINARDMYKGTPLHAAACHARAASARTLLEHGADVNAENDRGQTPLGYALSLCVPRDIAPKAGIAELLLNSGAKITADMAESVTRVGKDFEFHRANYNKELLPEAEAGLARLYELFGVAPVPKRRTHDGISPIAVPEGKWHEQHEALWQLLVPGRGQAGTVQGETVRLSGKLAREIMDNGGINWDDDFRKMLSALAAYFRLGNPLPQNECEEADALAKKLRDPSRAGSGSGGDEPERLMEFAVRWVKLNPNPIALGETQYRR